MVGLVRFRLLRYLVVENGDGEFNHSRETCSLCRPGACKRDQCNKTTSSMLDWCKQKHDWSWMLFGVIQTEGEGMGTYALAANISQCFCFEFAL